MTDEAGDAVLEALWTRVLEAWNDEKAHAALLEHALRSQALPDIAGRYRGLLGDGEKGALAKKKLDAIVIAATNMLWSMKTPKPGRIPIPITLSAFGVCGLLLLWLAWTVFGHR